MNIIIPMAGPDDLMQRHGYPFCKPLIEIANLPLIQHAWKALAALEPTKAVFVIRKEDDLRFHLADVLHLLEPRSVVVRADGPTAGAACTTLLAVEHIEPEEELLIANGDQVLLFGIAEAIRDFRARQLDAATVVFESLHPRWSFVRLDENRMVVEAAEKRPLSKYATAGVYYFRRGADFIAAAQTMISKGAHVNGAYFVCPSFNELVLLQKRIGVWEIPRSHYVSLATPQAIEEYEKSFLASSGKEVRSQ